MSAISITIEKFGNTLKITNFLQDGGLNLQIDQDGKIKFNDLNNNLQIHKNVINGHEEIDMNAVISSAREEDRK